MVDIQKATKHTKPLDIAEFISSAGTDSNSQHN